MARRTKRGEEPGKEPDQESERREETAEQGAETRGRFVVLLRHGVAEDRTGDKPDEERSLTSEGHARMKEVARGLAELFPKAEAIYSSPLLRAVQTALWVSKGYRSRVKVQTTDALRPDATADDFREFLAGLPQKRIVLVGHEPTLTERAEELTGLGGHLDLKKGGCYGIRLDGRGALEWLLPPRVLRRLGRK
jgi:phosphohistidine phosphatase